MERLVAQTMSDIGKTVDTLYKELRLGPDEPDKTVYNETFGDCTTFRRGHLAGITIGTEDIATELMRVVGEDGVYFVYQELTGHPDESFDDSQTVARAIHANSNFLYNNSMVRAHVPKMPEIFGDNKPRISVNCNYRPEGGMYPAKTRIPFTSQSPQIRINIPDIDSDQQRTKHTLFYFYTEGADGRLRMIKKLALSDEFRRVPTIEEEYGIMPVRGPVRSEDGRYQFRLKTGDKTCTLAIPVSQPIDKNWRTVKESSGLDSLV